MSAGDNLNWTSDHAFDIGGYTISLDYVHGGSLRKSTDRDFTIMKGRSFFKHYTDLIGGNYSRIIELGVYQGGSFVFLDQLLKPKKLVAVELSTEPIPALDNYINDSDGRTKLYYGTSQDDVEKLNEIVANDFDGQIDLVVDDASHFYHPTKTSFATLFPKLRPGGLYIIEDWSWGFQKPYQLPDNGWFDQAAPANLLIDLLEDMATGPLIEDIRVTLPLIEIRRSQVADGQALAVQARRGREIGLL